MLLSVPHYKQLKLRILLSAKGMSSALTCEAIRILGNIKQLRCFVYFKYRQA
jgi:hypothetical protein